jgi:adenosylcobinamide-GDP ribazoletransferase
LFALKSSFGFLTTIPVGISMEGIEAMMKRIYLFNLVGLTLGLILGALAFVLGKFLPGVLVALAITVAIYKLCGINHIDGLADFGDGVIAHGSLEKKVQAMKDVNLGTGGGVFIAVILLALYSAISSIPSALLPMALVVSEVSAKQSMVAFAAFSRSIQKGLGSMMIDKAGPKDFLMGVVLAGIICAAILGPLGLAMLLASQASALYLIAVSKRNFGGSTGDGIGASNEIARAFSLAAALALGGVFSWTFL